MVKAERDPVKKQAKRKQSEPVDEPPAKRSNTDDDDCVETGEEPWLMDGRWIHQVNEDWQHCMCAILGLNFVRSNRLGGGGPDVILTRPLAVKRIGGDGNCLFRCLSWISRTVPRSAYKNLRPPRYNSTFHARTSLAISVY